MSQSVVRFNVTKFQRVGGGIAFEQESVQPSDFTGTTFGSSGGKTYAQIYAEDEEDFNNKFPTWERFADYFVKRRPIYKITGKQSCETTSFLASDMANYIETGKVAVANFEIPGGFQGGSIP